MYGGLESSTRCKSKKTPANQENIFINFTTHALKMLTTQPNKETRTANKKYLVVLWLLAVRVFIYCVVSMCSTCCETDEDVFLICWCFFYSHVFSEAAARWALSATV